MRGQGNPPKESIALAWMGQGRSTGESRGEPISASEGVPPDGTTAEELDPEEPGLSDGEKAARMHVLEPADRGRVWTDYFSPVDERALGKGELFCPCGRRY